MTRMMPSQLEILTNRTIRRALKKTASNALRGACKIGRASCRERVL